MPFKLLIIDSECKDEADGCTQSDCYNNSDMCARTCGLCGNATFVISYYKFLICKNNINVHEYNHVYAYIYNHIDDEYDSTIDPTIDPDGPTFTTTDPGIDPFGPCGTNQPEVINASYAGHISSPGYPNKYPNNADCSWLLQANSDDVVQLTITEFDLESK